MGELEGALIHAHHRELHAIRGDVGMERREVIAEGFEDLGDHGRLRFEYLLLGCFLPESDPLCHRVFLRFSNEIVRLCAP